MKSSLILLLKLVLASSLFLSAQASAFSVWAVLDGETPSANSAGQPLVLDTGVVHNLDLYFSTQGDISWGWDIDLDFIGDVTLTIPEFAMSPDSGGGSMSLVPNGDINGNPGAETDDGYRQIGGNPLVDAQGQLWMFSLSVLLESSGSGIRLTELSRYTSGNTLSTQSIESGLLVTSVSQVPLPAAFWLFGSLLISLRLVRRVRSTS